MAKRQHGGKRSGAGRKPINPDDATTTISMTMPTGLVERLDAIAQQRGWNRSEAIREAIQGLLKRK